MLLVIMVKDEQLTMTLNIEKQVLSLLEPGLFKTTDQVVAEFRMEFPEQWKALKEEGEILYGNSCSSFHQPATRISLALRTFPDTHVLCLHEQGKRFWGIKE